jgi:excisionase family DNA binding protein
MALLTIKQVAERLAVSSATAYELCAQRKLAHLRLGVGRGTIRVDEQALDDFIKGTTVQPAEPAAPKAPPMRLKHLKV